MKGPRAWALEVLTGLESGPQRLEKLLHQTLGRHSQSPPRDRALATRLVYTVLRQRGRLDHLLAAFVSRPLAKLDPPVLAVLRLGAADIVFLDTPDHAAVGQAVALAKAGPARPAAGMVNAALRALARSWREVPPPTGDVAARLAAEHSHPRWLVEELLAQWPAEEVAAWLAANQTEARLHLRVNTLKATVERVTELLAPKASSIAPHPLCAQVLVLEGVSGPVRRLPGFGRGLWQTQDAGAAALSLLVGARPGLRVLDLCAGAGGKTGHLAALMENQGHLLAVEKSPGRVRGLAANLERLGVTNVEALTADATELTPSEVGLFDRVLIDAPCSGLGTVGRRPDVRWRRTPEDAARLAALQAEILAAGARLVAPGGALVYATCTVTRAENQAVADGLADPGLTPAWDREAAGGAAAAIGPDGDFRTLPHRHQSDAFFARRWQRPA